MFADDGLLLSEESIDVRSIIESEGAKRTGLNLAYDKKFGECRIFKFLGLEYDLDNRLVSYTKKKTDQVLMLNLDTASIAQLEMIAKYAQYKFENHSEEEDKTISNLSMVGKVKD
jgi:hypothetical protein